MIKEILVTGAGGLVGSALCARLFYESIPFVALYRKEPNNIPLWDYIVADIENDDLKSLTKGIDFFCVMHTAAAIPTSNHTFEDCFKTNTKIDNCIADFVKARGITRLVFISSTSIYGISDKVITENTRPKIENSYSLAKLNSENLFLNIPTIQTFCLRINAPYSYNMKVDTVLKIFIERALKSEDILLHGTGKRQQDFTHVKDIVSAVFACLKNDVESDVFNISSGSPISMKKLALTILSLVPESKSHIVSSGKIDIQEDHEARFSIVKAKKKLLWRPVISLEKGIQEWINFLKN